MPTETALGPLVLYALTRIYSMKYTTRVELVFGSIAEPNRRALRKTRRRRRGPNRKRDKGETK